MCVGGYGAMNPQKELDAFLKNNPHLMPFQHRISKKLNEVPEEMRIIALSQLLVNNLQELATELTLLQIKIEELNASQI
jgi:hypothetical protein